jgi:vancomycin resistance protein VanW
VNTLEKKILDQFEKIKNQENPRRIALSRKYPLLKKPIIIFRCLHRHILNLFDSSIKNTRINDFYPCIISSYQFPLRRKSGNNNPGQQDNKITNMKQAIKKLNGIVIAPDKIFSFWNTIGAPTYKNGYVDGIMLSNGKIIESAGGGLCQLSNFVYRTFLNVPVEVVEKHPHSSFAFPDSGVLTVFYNFIDLKIKNKSKYPIQLKIWTTNDYLKAQILSPEFLPEKIYITEKNFCFIKKEEKYYRYKEIYKKTKRDGKTIKKEKIETEFLPVLFGINDEYILENKYKYFDFNKQAT